MIARRRAVVVTALCVLCIRTCAAGEAGVGERRGRMDLYGDPLPCGAILRLGTRRLRHHKYDTSRWIAFSPDGRSVASADSASVHFWEVETGSLSRSLETGPRLRVPSLSPDGRRIAAAGKIWDLQTGEPLTRLEADGLREPAEVLHFSMDGRTVAGIGSMNCPWVVVWDAATGEEKLRFRAYDTSNVWWMILSPDGKRIATSPVGTIASAQVWDAVTGNLERTLDLATPNGRKGGPYLNTMAFAPDSKTIAAGYSDGSVRLRDVATGEARTVLQGPNRTVSAVAFRRDGRTMASAWYGGVIVVWDPKTRKKLRTMTGPEAYSEALAFSPDGKTLASVSGKGTIRLWDPATGNLKPTPPDPREVKQAFWLRDGRLAVESATDQTSVWDVRRGTRVRADRLDPYSPEGPWTAKAGYKEISVIDSATGETISRWSTEIELTRAAAAARRPMLACAWLEEAPAVSVWHWPTRVEMLRLPGHVYGARLVAFSPDEKSLLTLDCHGIALVWTLEARAWAAQLNESERKAPDRLWTLLGEEDSRAAYAAMCALELMGDDCVPFVEARLETIREEDRRLRKWLQGLENADWDARSKAAQALEALGIAARPALRYTMEHGSAEASFVCELLLNRTRALPQHPRGERLRRVRALLALERIGTERARAALRNLAEKAPLTLEAQYAEMLATTVRKQVSAE